MSSDPGYHVRPVPSSSGPRAKPHPKSTAIGVPFTYSPSDDGTDENLLLLLHGLGDTHTPFGKLGRSFKLPQTATLALRAPEQIPYLYEQAFQWYNSFDMLGELLASPNPTPALDLLSVVLSHLITDCLWPPHRIHIFGFAQGGTVAAESALKWWRGQPSTSSTRQLALGSVVTVAGPLVSYPTLTHPCPTPVLVFFRPAPSESAMPANAIAAFKKGFSDVREVRRSGEGMPRSKDEWAPIMQFWSERLGRRQVEGLYEVMSGTNSF
ncbi:hypothetical protein OF83DRAFT_1057625 [Amylostereum chailletii]|nr:hypothetical protein OF83DRAFT_1057625 [Amylostereum chailletii]